jgi:hypothetical protein
VSGANVRPANAQLRQILVLNSLSILGSLPAVVAGFTSATGSAQANHDILSWTFTGSFQPIGGPTLDISVSNSTNPVLVLPGTPGSHY